MRLNGTLFNQEYKEYEETCTCNYSGRNGSRYGGMKQGLISR